MKKTLFILFITIMLVFTYSCNKTTKPSVSHKIEGNISFYDTDGSLIDSLITATISIYDVEAFVDSINTCKQDYNNVFSELQPEWLADYRVLGAPVQEIQTTGKFEIPSLDINKAILVYKAAGFGWHYDIINDKKSNIELKMRRKLVINEGLYNEDLEWGPDQFIYIPNDFYCYGNLTIHENTVIALEDVKLDINSSIQAEGTKTKPILFTSYKDNPKKGDWKQINLQNTASNCTFNYSIIRWSNFGIQAYQNLEFNNSALLSSFIGILIQSTFMEINNSLFKDTDYGVKIRDTDNLDNQSSIKNTIFMNCKENANYIRASSPIIQNNIYDANTIDVSCVTEGGHAHYGTYPVLENCVFKNNTLYNFSFSRAGPIIKYCNFEENDNVTNIYCSNVYNAEINHNNFLDTDQHFFIKLYYRSGGSQVDAKNNWWKTTQEEQIQNLIYDENDEPGGDNIGYVEYSPWESQKIYNAGPQ